MPRIRELIHEIHRRSLWQVVGIYLGGSWVALQVVQTIVEAGDLPDWLPGTALVLLVIGFPIVVATAFIQEGVGGSGDRAERLEDGEAGTGGLSRRGAATDRDGRARAEARRSPAYGRIFTWRNAIAGGVAVFALWGVVAAGWLIFFEPPGETAAADSAEPAIAVLPFRVVGSDLESWWGEGLVDLLSTNLETVSGIRKVDPRAVMSVWRREVGEGAQPSRPDQAMSVARRVGARWALTGSVVGRESGVRLEADVYDLVAGDRRGTVRVEGAADSVFRLVDRLSIEILRAGLLPEAIELPRVDLSRITTGSLEALRAYLEGEQAYRRSRWTEARDRFRHALELDSTFAIAAYRLALSNVWPEGGGSTEQALEDAGRAARYADRLPERERLLVRSAAELLRGHPAALDSLERLVRRYPDDVDGWTLLGDAYRTVGDVRLLPGDAHRRPYHQAIALNPYFGPPYIPLLLEGFFLGDSAGLRPLIDGYRSIDSEVDICVGVETGYWFLWGDAEERARADARVDTLATDPLTCAAFVLELAGEAGSRFELLGRAAIARRTPSSIRDPRTVLLDGRARAGRIRGAREILARLVEERPDLGYHGLRYHLVVYPDSAAARRDAEVVRSALADHPLQRFWLGALAAAERRWADVESEARELEGLGRETAFASVADSLAHARGPVIAEALRAYATLRRHGPDRGSDRVAAVLAQLPGAGPGASVQSFLRYETGRALVEARRPRSALRWLESFDFYDDVPFPYTTQVALQLGSVYEALGDAERARYHYARSLDWLEDPDPELLPRRDEARRALERLLERPGP